MKAAISEVKPAYSPQLGCLLAFPGFLLTSHRDPAPQRLMAPTMEKEMALAFWLSSVFCKMCSGKSGILFLFTGEFTLAFIWLPVTGKKSRQFGLPIVYVIGQFIS